MKKDIEIHSFIRLLQDQLNLFQQEYHSYQDTYYTKSFYKQEIQNYSFENIDQSNSREIHNQFKKGETYFDIIHESISRNTLLTNLYQSITTTITQLQDELVEINRKIIDEKETLGNLNNRILEELKKFHSYVSLDKSLSLPFHPNS